MNRAREALIAVSCSVGLVLAGCSAADGGAGAGDGSNVSGRGSPAPIQGRVTVLAAASLTDPFEQVKKELADAYPELEIVFSFGPSSGLAEQAAAGAPADILATADTATMETATSAGVVAGEPDVFATNTLTLVVPPGNPGDVTDLSDLSGEHLRVAICEPRVPCGAAAEELLSRAAVDAAPDTLTTDVKEALALAALGEVDAALVYTTDAAAAGDQVESIPVDGAEAVVNQYPIALLRNAENLDGARVVLDAVSGALGASILTEAGFGVP